MPYKEHHLKTIQPYYEAVRDREKTFEVRKNDRDFEVGDMVYLQEFNQTTNEFSNRSIVVEITYILKDFLPIHKDFIVFGFKILAQRD